MKEQIFKNHLSETIFRQAIIDNLERDIAETCKQPDIEVSERQERRMKKLFAKERRRKRGIAVRLWAKRLIAAAALIFAVFGGALLTASQVRATVADVFVKWFNNFTQFGQNASTTDEVFIPDWHPTKLPEGFSEIRKSQIWEIITILYVNEQSVYLKFQCVPNGGSLSVNNENAVYAQILHEGIVYHTFTADSSEHQSAVVWDTDGLIFTISANLPIEQILDIAWSVIK